MTLEECTRAGTNLPFWYLNIDAVVVGVAVVEIAGGDTVDTTAAPDVHVGEGSTRDTTHNNHHHDNNNENDSMNDIMRSHANVSIH